jgi:protoporphyrinogen oxidase
MLDPQPQSAAREAAEGLRYRDFLTVAIISKDRLSLPDNWIYIHDPSVKVGRVQNFKSWSPELVPDSSLCCFGLEYFCFEGDGVWSMKDCDLADLAVKELQHLGLIDPKDVQDHCVVRQAKAYPVYDDNYRQNVDAFVREMNAHYPRLHMVGRNGMHKYNNQDHAMMTAMLTAKNIIADDNLFDVWQVNQDAEYHESGGAGEQVATSGLRMVPERISAPVQAPTMQ